MGWALEPGLVCIFVTTQVAACSALFLLPLPEGEGVKPNHLSSYVLQAKYASSAYAVNAGSYRYRSKQERKADTMQKQNLYAVDGASGCGRRVGAGQWPIKESGTRVFA